MNQSKWGISAINAPEVLGEYSCYKIFGIQSFVILVLLILIQPKIIKQNYHDQRISQVDAFKTIIITAGIVTGTYYIPYFLRD